MMFLGPARMTLKKWPVPGHMIFQTLGATNSGSKSPFQIVTLAAGGIQSGKKNNKNMCLRSLGPSGSGERRPDGWRSSVFVRQSRSHGGSSARRNSHAIGPFSAGSAHVGVLKKLRTEIIFHAYKVTETQPKEQGSH
ncbi:hypothetical protein TNCV_3554791 [Trichonephila clavipes]|nr:hypothetical protein TNCV_3554791 [Trichonephila clavipes]